MQNDDGPNTMYAKNKNQQTPLELKYHEVQHVANVYFTVFDMYMGQTEVSAVIITLKWNF